MVPEVGWDQAVDGLEQGGFPGAAAAQENDGLARLHVKADVAQDRAGPPRLHDRLRISRKSGRAILPNTIERGRRCREACDFARVTPSMRSSTALSTFSFIEEAEENQCHRGECIERW